MMLIAAFALSVFARFAAMLFELITLLPLRHAISLRHFDYYAVAQVCHAEKEEEC